MAKLDPLEIITTGFNSTTQLNNNFTKLTAALENTLSRDGSTPNFMDALFDMNSNRIINLADPVDPGDAVSLNYLGANFTSPNLFLTVTSTAGLPTSASNPTDTLNLVAGANMTITGDGSGSFTFTSTGGGGGGGSQNLFETIAADVGPDSTAATTTDTLTLVGGTNVSTSNDGLGNVTINSSGDPDQNIYLTIAADAGANSTASTTSDTLSLIGGTNVTTSSNGAGQITIDSAGNPDQNLFETIIADGGANSVAGSTTDSLSIIGGTNVNTQNDGAGTITINATSGAPNAFASIQVATQGDVVADSPTDILTMIAGAGITITTTPLSDSITISSAAVPIGATQFNTETFVDTVGYTAGVSNSITLATTPFSADSLLIFFNGLNQHVPEITSVIGNVVTFTNTIPVGTASIQVYALADPVYGGFAALPDQTIVSAGAIGPFAHGLASTPTGYELSLVCTTAEFGYSIGDIVPVDFNQTANRGVSVVLDATNVTGRFGSDANVFEALNFTTGVTATLTNGSWDLRIRVLQ